MLLFAAGDFPHTGQPMAWLVSAPVNTLAHERVLPSPLGGERSPNSGYTHLYAGDKSVDRNREYPYPLSTVVLPESMVGEICFVVTRIG